jgi:hypothetical protein
VVRIAPRKELLMADALLPSTPLVPSLGPLAPGLSSWSSYGSDPTASGFGWSSVIPGVGGLLSSLFGLRAQEEAAQAQAAAAKYAADVNAQTQRQGLAQQAAQQNPFQDRMFQIADAKSLDRTANWSPVQMPKGWEAYAPVGGMNAGPSADVKNAAGAAKTSVLSGQADPSMTDQNNWAKPGRLICCRLRRGINPRRIGAASRRRLRSPGKRARARPSRGAGAPARTARRRTWAQDFNHGEWIWLRPGERDKPPRLDRRPGHKCRQFSTIADRERTPGQPHGCPTVRDSRQEGALTMRAPHDAEVLAALDVLDQAAAVAAWKAGAARVPTLRSVAERFLAYPPVIQDHIARAIARAVAVAINALREEGVPIDDDPLAAPHESVH